MPQAIHPHVDAQSHTEPKMFSFSRAELERRWSLVRNHLIEQDLQALVIQGYEDKTGGYVKWLTDTPAGYPKTVIVHANDLMTLVDNGPQGRRKVLDGSSPEAPGIGEVITTWAFQTATFTSHLNAEATVEVIKSRGYRRIALAGVGLMPHGFVSTLRAGLAGSTELVDKTDFLDQCKARKSEEEMAQLRKAAAAQDEVFALLLQHIKPGMRNFEVNAFADYQMQLRGAERGTYIGRAAPIGQPSVFGYRHLQNRTIQSNDHITILLESNGFGGLWTEMARTICLGKPSSEMIDGLALCVEGQALTAKLLTPGTRAADVARAFNEFMVSRGANPEQRLYSHAQGYDMVERPLVREDETMTVEAGYNFAIHPTYATPTNMAHICDGFTINSNGLGGFLHQTPKKLFEI